MILNLYKKKNEIIIILIFSLIFFSINSKSYDLLNLFNSKVNLIIIINALRSIGGIIALIILSILMSINYFILKKKINLDIIVILFLLFITFQLIGNIINPKVYENLIEYSFLFEDYSNKYFVKYFILFDENYYLINLLSILIFFTIVINYFKYFKFEYLLIFTFFFLALYNIPLFIVVYKNFLFGNEFWGYATMVTDPSTSLFNQPVPRVTGLSRSLLIIYIFLSTFYFFYQNKNNKFNIIILFLALLFGYFLWVLQSRTILVSKFFLDAIFLIFTSNKNYKKKIFYYILLTITPIFLLYATIYLKNLESRTRLIADFKEISNLNFDNYSNTKILNQNRIFVTNSSGRTQIWNEILNKSKNSLMFGYGSQSDRFYINRDKKEFSNASSAFFYSLICAGLFGILIYFLICANIIKLMTVYIKKKLLIPENEIISKCSLFIMISILLRSLVENSFMIFSVDNLLFLICYFILIKKLKIST
jgi:hypothetical protein